MVFTLGLMVGSTRVTGWMVSNMDMGNIFSKMQNTGLVFGSMESVFNGSKFE